MERGADAKLRHPRVTKAYAESLIDVEKYHIDKELSVVICLVMLKSGQRFLGDAMVANCNLFEEQRGKGVARKKVINKIMESEMYVLRTKLYEENQQGK